MAVLGVMALILFTPNACCAGAVSGLMLCGNIIIPSLFPCCVMSCFLTGSAAFEFLGKICSPLKKVFNLSGKGICVIFLSLISGYPVGAKLVKGLYEQNEISESEAKMLVCCCTNPGPAFVILAVGKGMLGSAKAGCLLFLSGTFACLLLNIIFKAPAPCTSKGTASPLPLSDAFVSSVSVTCRTVLEICGWVVLFSALLASLKAVLPANIHRVISAFCEVTTATLSLRHNIYLVALCISWCGFSVHAQVMAASRNIKPNYLMFAGIRLLHGIITVIILKILLLLFPVALPAASGAKPVYSGNSASLPAAVALFITCIIFLLSLKKSRL